MKQIFTICLLALLCTNCITKKTDTKHIFYLHGRIIEVQGVNAISEKFGKYQYHEIIDSLKSFEGVLYNEIRTENTDFENFSLKISNQIDSLISLGTKPNKITIIGASKGAVIAMNISNQNNHEINYVLLGANNAYIEQENDWNLHGNILGIYEKSDSLAGRDYSYWIEKSTNANRFEQLQINTGLGHGFLYKPLLDWLEPARNWLE